MPGSVLALIYFDESVQKLSEMTAMFEDLFYCSKFIVDASARKLSRLALAHFVTFMTVEPSTLLDPSIVIASSIGAAYLHICRQVIGGLDVEPTNHLIATLIRCIWAEGPFPNKCQTLCGTSFRVDCFDQKQNHCPLSDSLIHLIGCIRNTYK